MRQTALIFSPMYYRHNTGRGHPESAQRLRAIVNELKRSALLSSGNCLFVQPEEAQIEKVQLVHGIEYIRLIEAVCRNGGGLLDLQDTVTSPESFKVALNAVGGTLKAVNLIMERQFENAFVLARPPGHHAGKYRALGFCIFNNVAIAAEHLIKRFKLKRVAILDVDAHHGNGLQEIFYETSKVLYISLHEDPYSFPGTGFADETGEHEGLGYNVNIPLPFGTGDRIYLRALQKIVEPIVSQYKPQFMLISAGFDGHYMDPVGNLSLSISFYRKAYESIIRLAEATCKDHLVSVLEGGYNLKTVGKLCSTAIACMSKTSYNMKEKIPPTRRNIELQGWKAIEEVEKVQREFWNID